MVDVQRLFFILPIDNLQRLNCRIARQCFNFQRILFARKVSRKPEKLQSFLTGNFQPLSQNSCTLLTFIAYFDLFNKSNKAKLLLVSNLSSYGQLLHGTFSLQHSMKTTVSDGKAEVVDVAYVNM
jgi:hypothetical protein